MHSISNIVFAVFAALGALLVAIPLPRALASGNVGTSMLMVWTELACLIQFANAIRWNRNVENWAPGWCDFCGYFFIAVDVALAACGVSINRRLYMIVTLDPKEREKVFNILVDFVLCFVFPCACVALEYTVQQYRFIIYEDVGCFPGVGTSNLSFPFVWMLPLLVGVVSAGYACLTIRANFRRNHRIWGESGRSSAWSRRLTTIGAISTLYGLIPTSISVASLAIAYPVTPWPGWKAIHSTIDVIIYVPAHEWHTSLAQITSIELRRWTIVTIAFIVFLLLGLTEDVKNMYAAPFRNVTEQTFSVDRTSRGATLEQHGDLFSNHQKDTLQLFTPRPAVESSRFRHPVFGFITPGEPRKARKQGGGGLSDKLTPDSDLEGFELVISISRPPAAQKSGYELGGYPGYT